MTDDIVLEYTFPDLKSLKRAFMPFVNQGGIFIQTKTDFKLGEFVKATLTLPESNLTYSFSGEVIWISPNSNQRPGVGITCNSEEGQAFKKATVEMLAEWKGDDKEMTDTM